MKIKAQIILAALLVTTGAYAQTPIDHVLKSIEANNKTLQANAQLTASQKLEAQTDNNLPDPTFSYAHMRGAGRATISEMTLSQRFDFPTLYAGRRKLNKLKAGAFDSQAEAFRRDILLQAQAVCLDIIMLRQQQTILEERLKNARELSDMYARRLEQGDANIIETNKINLELLNVKTEANLNASALQNKLQALEALNGNVPVAFNETDYPPVAFPSDYEQLRTEVLSSDRALLALQQESRAADKQVGISKAQGLPKLELGYRRNTESGLPFNGVLVGFSIPLFENRNKVKTAKAQSLNLNYRKESAALQIESELAQSYKEALALRASMDEYEKTFAAQSDLSLLKEALTGGEISMIEYFVEVAVVYQSKLNYLQLQNQYQKALAGIYKNRL
jgi:outer membrane protein TolC